MVAEAVSKAFPCDKLNYELLGNGDSHLHWHIFPRRNGDLDGYGNEGKGPVWWYPKEMMYSEENKPNENDLSNMKKSLQLEIDKLIHSSL